MMKITRRLGQPGLWLIAASPSVAILHFLVLYVGTAVTCAKFGAEAMGALRLFLLAFTAAALGVVVLVGTRAWRQWDLRRDGQAIHSGDTPESRHRFLGHVAFLLSVMSVIGMIYITLPLLVGETCR